MGLRLTSYQFHVLWFIGISGSALVSMNKACGREGFAALLEILQGIGRGVLLYGDPGVGDDGRHVG